MEEDLGPPHVSDFHAEVRLALDSLQDTITVQQTLEQRMSSLNDAYAAITECIDITGRALRNAEIAKTCGGPE